MKVIILLLLKEFWEPHWCFQTQLKAQGIPQNLCWNLDVLSPNFPLNLSPKTSESCMSYPKCRKCMHQMNELCDEHSLHLPERWSRLVISRTCKTPRFPHIPTSSSSEPVASQCIALALSKQVAMMGFQISPRLFIDETRKMMSSLSSRSTSSRLKDWKCSDSCDKF